MEFFHENLENMPMDEEEKKEQVPSN